MKHPCFKFRQLRSLISLQSLRWGVSIASAGDEGQERTEICQKLFTCHCWRIIKYSSAMVMLLRDPSSEQVFIFALISIWWSDVLVKQKFNGRKTPDVIFREELIKKQLCKQVSLVKLNFIVGGSENERKHLKKSPGKHWKTSWFFWNKSLPNQQLRLSQIRA